MSSRNGRRFSKSVAPHMALSAAHAARGITSYIHCHSLQSISQRPQPTRIRPETEIFARAPAPVCDHTMSGRGVSLSLARFPSILRADLGPISHGMQHNRQPVQDAVQKNWPKIGRGGSGKNALATARANDLSRLHLQPVSVWGNAFAASSSQRDCRVTSSNFGEHTRQWQPRLSAWVFGGGLGLRPIEFHELII